MGGLEEAGFVEDIYDTSLSYPETDLHKKTKELENLLANMEADQSTDDEGGDEYVEVNPDMKRRVSNHLPDYVNFDQKRRISFDVPGQDDYVEMTASLRRQSDKRLVKFVSSEDMYI